ncbi:hypothetical protein MNBD_CHLOROFLEXI01-524, partial [hydrothermal vent metagenome]
SGQAPRDLPWRAEPEMVPLPEAGKRFHLSVEALTAALKNGRFLTWRLEHGSQYRWYLQEKASDSAQPADSQPK